LIYFIYLVFWCGVNWSSGNCIIDQPLNFLCPYLPLREELYYSMFTCVCVFCLAKELSKHSFSKCSEQTWHWLSLGKFALLIRTSHSLRNDLFFKGSRWKLIPLLKSLGVLFEQPRPEPFAVGDDVFLKFALLVRGDVMLCAQAFNMAFEMADVQIVLVRRFLLLQSG